ncbi:MAG: hypothetical protein ABFS19_11770 [Thermodesulfobacteriota bacterium]
MKLTQAAAAAAALITFSFCGQALAVTQPPPSKVEWTLARSWKLPAQPIDLVYSLDGKRVFILSKDHNVLVYTAQGNLLGSIPVDKGVTAIDIAPRGGKLYLTNGDLKQFSELNISFVVDINTEGSPFLGLADAPISVVVFTDFE